MGANAHIQSAYINLPVESVGRARAFWEKLGFGFNEQFSDEKAACLMLNEQRGIYAMLIGRDAFKAFTNRPISDGMTTQARAGCIATALPDPDGHQWEVAFMDASAIPQNS